MPPRGFIPGRSRISALEVLVPSARTNIRGVGPETWFSPLQPIPPVAPTGTVVRQWDFPLGANIEFGPRMQEGALDFHTLREMADSVFLFRAVLQALKDKVSAVPWEVRLRRDPSETKLQYSQRNATDKRITELTQFFQYPDGFHSWSAWIRIWLEELMVLDAAPIFLQRDDSQTIRGLVCLAGHTISRKLDRQGLTPTAPDVAYQQVLYGLPAINLTTDDLVYVMRNERAWRKYGFSPVEHIIVALAIALRRQDFQLKYYTSGSVPEALVFLPGDLPVKRVEEVQNWFDSMMSGDSSRRRRVTFLPGYSTGEKDARPNIVFPKEALIKDDTDEWLARVIAYNLGMSPQQLVKMMNRAQSEESTAAAEEEGLGPILTTIDETMTLIINRHLGAPDIEFWHRQKRETDPKKQMEVVTGYVKGGIYTVNNALEELGRDASDDPMADVLGVITGSGFFPLAGAPTPSDEPPTNGDGKETVKNAPTEKDVKDAKKYLSRATRIAKLNAAAQKIHKTDGGMNYYFAKASVFSSPGAEAARIRMRDVLKAAFKKMRAIVWDQSASAFPVQKLQKGNAEAARVAEEIYQAAADQAVDIIDELESILNDAALQGVGRGLAHVPLIEQQVIQASNTAAGAYAMRRAAEMVGMKRAADGTLTENPQAKWRITKELRDKIRAAVEKAFESDTPIETLRESIDASGIFNFARADMIARTEVQMAQVRGSMSVWKESGVVEGLTWTTGLDPCEVCEGNDGVTVRFGEAFPSGDDSPPVHPQCMCDVAPELEYTEEPAEEPES